MPYLRLDKTNTHTINIVGGVRSIDETGPRGGTRRRFQPFIDRRESTRHADRPLGEQYEDDYTTYYGATFARQWEAAQATSFAREQCAAVEVIFAWLRRSAA